MHLKKSQSQAIVNVNLKKKMVMAIMHPVMNVFSLIINNVLHIQSSVVVKQMTAITISVPVYGLFNMV